MEQSLEQKTFPRPEKGRVNFFVKYSTVLPHNPPSSPHPLHQATNMRLNEVSSDPGFHEKLIPLCCQIQD